MKMSYFAGKGPGPEGGSSNNLEISRLAMIHLNYTAGLTVSSASWGNVDDVCYWQGVD